MHIWAVALKKAELGKEQKAVIKVMNGFHPMLYKTRKDERTMRLSKYISNQAAQGGSTQEDIVLLNGTSVPTT